MNSSTKMRSPRLAPGAKIGKGRECINQLYCNLVRAVNIFFGRLRLRMAERAVNRPFDMRASLRLDRAWNALQEALLDVRS